VPFHQLAPAAFQYFQRTTKKFRRVRRGLTCARHHRDDCLRPPARAACGVPGADLGSKNQAEQRMRSLKARRNRLLTAQAENCLRTRDGGRTPLAGEHLRLRRINAQRQGKRPSGGWKPVGILALTRTFVLKIEIEGTVRVKLERHPATDGKPIEWVRNREALRIIKCSRPKGVCGGVAPLPK
jgi:hypothetical protein